MSELRGSIQERLNKIQEELANLIKETVLEDDRSHQKSGDSSSIGVNNNSSNYDDGSLSTTKSDARSNHIGWHEYFMSVAQLAAKRSKDPSTQVGACIVNAQNKIVATGYNGMPNGIHDDIIPWKKDGSFLDTKYAYVVHAELNAILNSILTDQTNCRLYVSLFPCNECAKAIIQSGIRHVIYLSDKHQDKESTIAAKRMFEMTGVLYEKYSLYHIRSPKQDRTLTN